MFRLRPWLGTPPRIAVFGHGEMALGKRLRSRRLGSGHEIPARSSWLYTNRFVPWARAIGAAALPAALAVVHGCERIEVCARAPRLTVSEVEQLVVDALTTWAAICPQGAPHSERVGGCCGRLKGDGRALVTLQMPSPDWPPASPPRRSLAPGFWVGAATGAERGSGSTRVETAATR
jgi:hypothetical protein